MGRDIQQTSVSDKAPNKPYVLQSLPNSGCTFLQLLDTWRLWAKNFYSHYWSQLWIRTFFPCTQAKFLQDVNKFLNKDTLVTLYPWSHHSFLISLQTWIVAYFSGVYCLIQMSRPYMGQSKELVQNMVTPNPYVFLMHKLAVETLSNYNLVFNIYE